MHLVIDKLTEVLLTAPDPVLSASRLGARTPSSLGEVPRVAISVTNDSTRGTGLGGFFRAGDTPARSTSVVEVAAAPATFSADLRTLRIAPLPLRRNPASVDEEYGAGDVEVANVTDPGQPLAYRLRTEPSRADEFALDVPRARVVFGRPQQPGDRLRLVHWTVTRRDEVLGQRYSGAVTLEFWGTDADEVGDLSRSVEAKLRNRLVLLRQKGFSSLRPKRLEAAEGLRVDPPQGSPFGAWKQRAEYRYAFEAEEGGELSSGVAIERIDVDVDDHLEEQFSVTR